MGLGKNHEAFHLQVTGAACTTIQLLPGNAGPTFPKMGG